MWEKKWSQGKSKEKGAEKEEEKQKIVCHRNPRKGTG